MSDNTPPITLRARALAAHAAQAEQTRHEEETKTAERLAQNRADSYQALSTRLKDILGITEGFSVEHPDFQDAYAVLDDLPDFRFFAVAMQHSAASPIDRLRVEATLPEHPDTDEYADWWENPENKQVSQLNSTLIASLAGLGRFIAAREAAGSLVIKSWPPKPAPEPAVEPSLPKDRVACLTLLEANATTRPYTIIAGVTLADGTPAVIVQYTDRHDL